MEQFLALVYYIFDNQLLLFLLFFLGGLSNTFFPPIPVELGAVFAGYLISTGHGSTWLVIVAATAGMFLGNFALYSLVRYYGPGLIQRPWFQKLVPSHYFEKAVRWFQKYGVWSLFIAKFLPGMHFGAVVASGILKLGIFRAIFGFMASNFITFVVLVHIGFHAQDQWREAYAMIGRFGITSFFIITALIVTAVILVYRSRKRKKNSKI